LGDTPTVEEMLRAMLAQWEDGGSTVAAEAMSKGAYERLEGAVNTIEELYCRYKPPDAAIINGATLEKLRAELEGALNDALTSISDLDGSEPENVIGDLNETIIRARGFLEAYKERAWK